MAKLSQATAGGASTPGSAAAGGTAGAPVEPTAGRPEVLIIVCAGVVLASLDLFIVNVALPAIAHDLGTRSLGDLSWVLNGYAIVYASLLVLAGKLADRHRRKYGFLLGVAIFTAASAACGAANSVAMLIAFRLVQAAGAALLTPTSLSLVLASYPPQRRSGAVRAWTATGGVAAAFGPVIGGLLVAASWRWVFLVNVPIGIAALVVGWRRLPDVPGHPVPRPDALGAVLVTGGVAALTLGLVQGGAWGWGSALTVAVLAGSAVLLALFVLHCARARNPLIEPALFRVRSFTGAATVMLLFSMSFGGMLLSLVLWLQDEWGWSALQAGLGIAPGPVMVPVFSFLVAGRLIVRFGPAVVVAAGLHRARRRRRLVGPGHRPGRRLPGRRPRRHAADRGGRRADPADPDGHRRGLAAGARLCHRISCRQHDPAGRHGHRGGRSGRGPRDTGHFCRTAHRVSAWLVGDRRHGPRRRRRHAPTAPSAGPAPAAAPARPAPRTG